MFAIVLHGDGSLKTGGPETLAADVPWLVCREVCVPRSHRFVRRALRRVDGGRMPGSFAQTQERLPQPLSKARASIMSAKDRLLIRLWDIRYHGRYFSLWAPIKLTTPPLSKCDRFSMACRSS
jgi:hypothetical protein